MVAEVDTVLELWHFGTEVVVDEFITVDETDPLVVVAVVVVVVVEATLDEVVELDVVVLFDPTTESVLVALVDVVKQGFAGGSTV